MTRPPNTISWIGAFLACVLWLSPASAQERLGLDQGLRISQYVLDKWGLDEGLPQNSVSSIAQTPDGYLWMGTQEGLVRFDGVQFTVFDPDNEPAFAASDIILLSTGPDGTLWMAVRRGGVVRYRDGEFTRIEGVPDTATAVSVDEHGTVWVGTFGAGLARIDGEEVTVFNADAGFTGRFIGLTADAGDGGRWVASDVGLLHFDGERFNASPFSELGRDQASIAALFAGQDGAVWVSTRQNGVFRIAGNEIFDRSDWLIPDGGYVRSMVRDAAGSLWLGQSNGGITRVSHGGPERFGLADGLSDNQVLSLFEDQEGALWIGTSGGGVNRLRRGHFAALSTAEGLPHQNAHSVFSDRQGRTWVGTEDGLAAIVNNRVTELIGIGQGLSNPHVQALAGDKSGRLYIGTNGGGLFVREPGGLVRQAAVMDQLNSPFIFALFVDSQQRLWVGTDAGVNVVDGSEVSALTSEDGLSSDFPTYFAEGPDGMWVATYDGGLNLVQDGRVARTLTTEDGLPEDGVLAISVEDSGDLWAGTYGGGLALIQGDKITTINRALGLFNNKVMSVVDDRAGRLWMSSNQGLFFIEKEHAREIAAGGRERLRSHVFDVHDGLKSPEASGATQPSAFLSPSGELWFPTTDGAAFVRPADLSLEAEPPQVLIERISVDDVDLNPRAPLELKAGSDRIRVVYTAPRLSKPEEVLFSFSLLGHESRWISDEGAREALYTNLKPGAYTLQVYAHDKHERWTSEPASLSFEIAPHFWETGWFMALCVLLLGGAAFGAYRVRIEAVKRKAAELERIVDERTHELREEKERTEEAKNVIEHQAAKLQELDRFKTRFFANVSHEFRTPLTMIIGPLENALSGRYGQVEGRVRRQMDIMLRNALRLMRLINQLLDLSKLEAGKMQLRAGSRNLVAFLNDVMLTITPFAEKKNLTLAVNAEESSIEVYYEPDRLEKVFYNLLSNAAKFTPAGGTLTIDVSRMEPSEAFPEGAAEVRVSDSGRGIPADALPHIFDRFHQVDGSNTRQHEGTGIGLSLVKEMVTLHGGTVEVASEVGQGTTFTIVFPIGRGHLGDDQVVSQGTIEYEAPELSSFASSEFETSTSTVSAEAGTAVAGINAPRILVVDDNPDVRDYVSSILMDSYRVVMAVDGVDGLEKARSESPDLILSDVMMPRMDGNELVRQLKADEQLKGIPVILVSARATQEVKVEGLTVGADDYVPKPFNAEELLARIANLLKLREHQKQLKLLNGTLEEKVEEQLSTILTERERYEAELIEERDRAEAASRMKSAILDNMNHEFRTPLSIIMGSSQLLAEEVPESLAEFLTAIQDNAGRLESTLHSVCEFASLAAGIDGTPAQVDISSVIRSCVDKTRPLAAAKGLEVHVHLPRDRDVTTTTDEASFRRIVEVLLDNAVKFTDSGSLRVELRETAQGLVTSVADTGVGIAEDNLATIFEAFTQSSQGLSRAHEGSGLGLAIAHRRAELIGGSLDVSSAPGVGSTFSLRLPALTPSPIQVEAKDADQAT